MLLRIYSQNIDGMCICKSILSSELRLLVLTNSHKHTSRAGLEETAGVPPHRIAYVHGSLKFATCEICQTKVAAAEFEDDILAGRVARCRVPRIVTPGTRSSSRKRTRQDSSFPPANICGGVLKPGVTFFGEALQDTVASKLESDREKADAMIVIGTSLSV